MNSLHELREAYHSAVSTHRGKIRIMMLKAIKQQMRQLELTRKKEEMAANKTKLEITETNDTNTDHMSFASNSNSHDLFTNSHILSASLTGIDQLCQLEARILEKQRLKFALNQEIEAAEDEYFGLQENIYRKREKTERLQKQIAWKSYEISKNSSEDVEEAQEESLAKKIMCFFLF